MSLIPIKNALISVFNKEGLASIAQTLDKHGVSIYSTGGTETFLKDLDIKVVSIESLTSYPSILGGRVKTLHPKVFGGILARREMKEDIATMDEYDIPSFDLVIVDLYPFEKTLASTKSEKDIIEKIDIGGVSLIRAAAKNYNDVLICSNRADYEELNKILLGTSCNTSKEIRKRFAAKAFANTSHYDAAIFNYFNETENIDSFRLSLNEKQVLRYGENPHQNAAYYGDINKVFTKLNGKELSYNNLLDCESAVNLISEFEMPSFAIIKHTNACGVACDTNLLTAWKKALAGDPVSAFGGIIITNQVISKEVAQSIDEIFFEIIIATGFENDALEILMKKKNRIILIQNQKISSSKNIRSVLNGVLIQDKDTALSSKESLQFATNLNPNDAEIEELLFAEIVCKHLKSNTIVISKNKQLLGMGCGQTSRVDALKQAINKAKNYGFELKGAAMASDAFFPFPDCVEIAHNEGINLVIQPGGSIKDKDSIDYCNANQMKMVLSGTRHFKH